MSMSKVKIVLGAIVGLSLLAGFFYLNSTAKKPATSPVQPVASGMVMPAKPRLPAPAMPAAAAPFEFQLPAGPPANPAAWLLRRDETPKLDAARLSTYLELNQRSGDALLAAYDTTGDPAFLREAREKNPRDPGVNFADLFAPNASAEERRRRLNAFRQSAPDNALPGYLLALDCFQSGQTDQGVEALVEAVRRPRLADYSVAFAQHNEEAYRAAGYSDLEAKAMACYLLPLPHLPALRELGRIMIELSAGYGQAGDPDSAQVVARYGLLLGRQLGEIAAQSSLSQNLAGLEIEGQFLALLDPAAPSDSTGQTAKARLEELGRRRTEILGFYDPANLAIRTRREKLLLSLSESNLVEFFNQVKTVGELAALRWAAQK